MANLKCIHYIEETGKNTEPRVNQSKLNQNITSLVKSINVNKKKTYLPRHIIVYKFGLEYRISV